jgi:threonine dehydrogenase-like Zn-dependent dehydrogenase
VLALSFDGDALRLARDQPEPTAGPGEAVVAVLRAGICSTDVEITRGYLGFRGTPGHEWVGRVIAAPDAPALVGTRVVGEINYACGRCTMCTAGMDRHCPTRRVCGIVGADGAFAERLCIPAAQLHRVPDDVPDRAAVFVEPLAAAFAVLEQVPDVAGRRAIILGDGKLGILVAQVLRAAGADVLLSGRHARKLDVARSLGVTVGTPLAGADLVVDASGSPDGLATAVALARPRGIVVMKTTVAAEHRLDLAPAVVNEVSLVGSRCGRFAPAIAALAAGRVAVEPLIDAEYPLADGLAAFERARTRGVLKVLLAVSR